MLSSCGPAIVVGATGTAAAYDERSLTTIYQDEGIAHQAMGEINNTPDLNGSNINIVSLNNIVLIVGQTKNQELKTLAYQVVHKVPNIDHIYNQISVAEPTTPITRSKDTWITTKVKAALLAESGIKSAQIKVITEDGVVYLLGIISPEQATQASNIARKVKDVKKVVKLFQTPEQKGSKINGKH